MKYITVLDTIMNDEYKYIQGLPQYVWRRLALVVGEDGYNESTLREDVLTCLVRSYAYISAKALKPMRSYPWCLATGDILLNLQY